MLKIKKELKASKEYALYSIQEERINMLLNLATYSKKYLMSLKSQSQRIPLSSFLYYFQLEF